jgi:exonuclease VII large subunit
MILLELKYLLENIKESKDEERSEFTSLRKLIPFDYQKLEKEHKKHLEEMQKKLQEKHKKRMEEEFAKYMREEQKRLLESKPTEIITEKSETMVEKTQKKQKRLLGNILSRILGRRKEE